MPRLDGRRALFTATAVAFGLFTTACRGPVISVDDAVVVGGAPARLAAVVEYEPAWGLRKDAEGIPVRFFIDGREVGRTATDDEGLAALERSIAPGVRTFEARAESAFGLAHATGRVFRWRADRVIIAVDIDHTLARTDYESLIRPDEEEDSGTLKHSAATLLDLAGDFHILYLTGRPRMLLDKTRAWLRERGYPDGPVITSRGLRELLRPGVFKSRELRKLRSQWPALRIGVSDKASDAEAYGANGMLTLIIAREREARFGAHALVFRDWRGLARFLADNRRILADPAALEGALEGRTPLAWTLPRYRAD